MSMHYIYNIHMCVKNTSSDFQVKLKVKKVIKLCIQLYTYIATRFSTILDMAVRVGSYSYVKQK